MFFSKYLNMRGKHSARFNERARSRDKSQSGGRMIEFLEARMLLTATYNFKTILNLDGSFGYSPEAGLILDASGDMFGTTYGANGRFYNDGTIFELVKNGANFSPTVLYSFSSSNGANGSNPEATLAMDSSGNLFGTTQNGAMNNDGTVFELVKSRAYALVTLYQFSGSDGNNPVGQLAVDANGDLFGDAEGGANGDGTVFELAKTRGGFAFSTLASFDGTNGYLRVQGGLVIDSQGDLFGDCEKFSQSSGHYTDGTVFEVMKNGGSYSLSDLVTFNSLSWPLAIDPSGNLYGSESAGFVYELVKGGNSFTLETLVNFPTSYTPGGGVLLDSNGNLFMSAGTVTGVQTFYEIAAGSGIATALATISGDPEESAFVMDRAGNLFAASTAGGPSAFGTIDELSPILHLAFATQPTTAVAGGLVNQVVVNVEDVSNNIFADYDAKVSLTATPAPGNIGGPVTNTAVNGVVIFKQCLEFTTAGTYSLQPTDTSGDPGALSNAFNITPAAASLLVFAAGPTSTTAGKIYNPPVVVYVMDIFHNIVRNVNTAVTLSVHSGLAGGTVHGTATVNLSNGAAIFSNVWLQNAGNYTLIAQDGSLTPIISPTFAVSAGTASKLVFTTKPATATHGVGFTVKVSVEDAFGNVLTSRNTGAITLALAAHPTGSFLTGTLTANVVNGVASFVNLSVNFAGTYTLQASDNFSIAATTSAAIVVS